MRELFRLIKVVGLRPLLRFRHARVWGWEGILRGHYMTRALQTVLALGLLDAMRKNAWIDPREFACANRLDPVVLLALCEYLYARRVLEKKDGRYTLDADGRFLVETNLLRGWFLLSHGYESVLGGLEPLARQQIRYGESVVRDGELVAVGSGLASSSIYFPLVTDIIMRERHRIVLDVGCGDGTFLRHLCRSLPNVRGVGLDLSPEAVARGRQTNEEEGFADRIELIAGDATDPCCLASLPKGIDAATAFFVLHEFAAAADVVRLVAFLRTFRQTLPGVSFIIVETIRPSAEVMRANPGPAIEYFLFHDLSLQVPLDRDVWQSALKDAGFTSVSERYLPSARSALYVVQ